MKKKGFTLIEFIAVIAIIAMLMVLLIPAFKKLQELVKAQEQQAEQQESKKEVSKEYRIEYGYHTARVIGLKENHCDWNEGYGDYLFKGIREIEKNYVIRQMEGIVYRRGSGSLTQELFLIIEPLENVEAEVTDMKRGVF